jgi:hypothetical protein
MVPKRYWKTWHGLPGEIRARLETLTDPKNQFISACHNKIKHGPQVVIQSLSSAVSARVHEVDRHITNEDEATIRVLLKGARTQESQNELDQGERVAPFLILNNSNLRRIYADTVATIVGLYDLVIFAFNSSFPGAGYLPENVCSRVLNIVDESLNKTPRLRLKFPTVLQTPRG